MKNKKLNRLRFLIHDHIGNTMYGIMTIDTLFSFSYLELKSYLYELSIYDRPLTLKERRKIKLNTISNPPKKKNINKNFIPLLEIKKLLLELNIDKTEYYKICSEEKERKIENIELLKVNNLKETRDNKGVYVGSDGSNINKIRYPKKNRSKRTWRIFYKMFPNAALADNFDGKTSKRMK